MKKCIIAALTILFLATTVHAANQESQAGPEISDEKQAVEWLKELYVNRDFELGALEGARFEGKFPESIEIQVWRISNMARANQTDEAIAKAEGLRGEHPQNALVLFAHAIALRWDNDRVEESLEMIETALDIDTDLPELHWMHVAILNRLDRTEEALEMIDYYKEYSSEPVRLMEMKGSILNSLVDERNGLSQDDVFDYYDNIREKDPENLSAHFFPGVYHTNASRFAEARQLMAKAAKISTAPDVHSRYWQTIIRNPDIPREEKIDIIETGIKNLEERRPETPALLMNIANTYNSLNLEDKRSHYAELILDQYPDSPEAEWMLVQKQRDFRSDHSDELSEGNEEIMAEYRQMMFDYLGRPSYHNPNIRGDVYLSLFMSFRDEENADTGQLQYLLEGMEEYNQHNPHLVYAEGPAIFAEKGGDTEWALELAGKGFEKLKESVERQREWGRFETEEEFETEVERTRSTVYNAKGWIYYHGGNLEKAEEYLVKAHTINSSHRVNLFRLGQLYEELNQPENAESYYVMGVGTTGMGNNPNEEALKNLYENTRGSLEGYDEFLEKVLAEDRTERRERILSEKLEEPGLLPAFELSDMDGNNIHSDEIGNNITAINFWGKWCGPCVAEMPDIQELYENYKDDDDVLILTINNDIDPDGLRDWLTDHDYTFPVLRDDGYINDSGVSVFPTTWFLNREGEIIYTQLGYTSELVEEFSWRIEELRGD